MFFNLFTVLSANTYLVFLYVRVATQIILGMIGEKKKTKRKRDILFSGAVISRDVRNVQRDKNSLVILVNEHQHQST